MSDNNKRPINIDVTGALFLIFLFVLILLFAGTPDLYDVILYRLSDGAVTLPKP